MPAFQVEEALTEIFWETTDRFAKSRAFDALLKLRDFDKVKFLTNLYDKSSPDWRYVCCQSLAEFHDERAGAKLIEVVQNDPDPDVRYAATEALAEIGDLTAVDALEYVKENDRGVDYEGFSVADMAVEALQKIYARAGMTR